MINYMGILFKNVFYFQYKTKKKDIYIYIHSTIWWLMTRGRTHSWARPTFGPI